MNGLPSSPMSFPFPAPLRPMQNFALTNRAETRQLDDDYVRLLGFILTWKNHNPGTRPCIMPGTNGAPDTCNAAAAQLLQAAGQAGIPLEAGKLQQPLHDICNIEQVVSILEGPNAAKALQRLQLK